MKKILLLSIFVNIFSLIIFILGTTAAFSRGMDLIGTFMVFLYSLISFALTISSVSIILYKHGYKFEKQIIFIFCFIQLVYSLHLIINTNTKGWLEDRVEEDNLQITSDDKYQYDIELINWFQTNSHIRLHMKDCKTQEDIYIELEIENNNDGYSGAYDAWSKLNPTNREGIYCLETTKEFSNQFHLPMEKFEIDITNRTSKKLSNE